MHPCNTCKFASAMPYAAFHFFYDKLRIQLGALIAVTESYRECVLQGGQTEDAWCHSFGAVPGPVDVTLVCRSDHAVSSMCSSVGVGMDGTLVLVHALMCLQSSFRVMVCLPDHDIEAAQQKCMIREVLDCTDHFVQIWQQSLKDRVLQRVRGIQDACESAIAASSVGDERCEVQVFGGVVKEFAHADIKDVWVLAAGVQRRMDCGGYDVHDAHFVPSAEGTMPVPV